MKRDPYAFKIAGILCLFNIPIILFFTVNNYSIWRIIALIFILVMTDLILAMYISNLLYFYHKSIVENMVKIESSPLTKKVKVISFIWSFGFYCVLLYLLTQKDTSTESIMPIINMMNLMYLPYLLKQGNFCSCYIGTINFIYGSVQVKVDDIERYEVNTLKKYRNQKKDRIKLKIFPKNAKEIVVFDSSLSYKLIEALDKIFEERYIEEKMKEYGLK